MKNKTNLTPKEYICPSFCMVTIQFDQNILGGSGQTPDFPGEDW